MTVTVLRFTVSEHAYALAAGCVTSVEPARAGVVHLATALGEPLPMHLHDNSRSLRVSANAGTVEVIVDGPVELVPLDADDVTGCPVDTRAGVLGFARKGERLTALLDAHVVVERVLELTRSEDAVP